MHAPKFMVGVLTDISIHEPFCCQARTHGMPGRNGSKWFVAELGLDATMSVAAHAVATGALLKQPTCHRCHVPPLLDEEGPHDLQAPPAFFGLGTNWLPLSAARNIGRSQLPPPEINGQAPTTEKFYFCRLTRHGKTVKASIHRAECPILPADSKEVQLGTWSTTACDQPEMRRLYAEADADRVDMRVWCHRCGGWRS
jgi:hypothetical protein